MSRAFDLYYNKHLRNVWKAKHPRRLGEGVETLIQRYNEIWQPAVDFVQSKLSDLPSDAEGTNDRLFMEALLGTLMSNKIRAEDSESIDAATLRQKVDGLNSKMDALRQDSANNELSAYIDTFVSGMQSFYNSIEVSGPDEETPPPDDVEAAPEGGGEAPPPEEGGEGEAPPPPKEGEKKDEPPPDENSGSSLLKDLNIV